MVMGPDPIGRALRSTAAPDQTSDMRNAYTQERRDRGLKDKFESTSRPMVRISPPTRSCARKRPMQTSAQGLVAPAADVTRQDQGEDRHAAFNTACMEPIFARLERLDDLRSVKSNVSSGESRSGEALLWYGASVS